MEEKIIQFLKKNDGHLSGEEISRQLKISRAGIWKHIQELRREGYEIAAVPHLGYRLVSSPDKLMPRELRHGLGTRSIGREIFYYDTVPSTMDTAFRLGMEGAKEGSVVCAEGQTRGKGRLGRNWVSPKGKGIYASMILRPSLLPSDAARLTLLAAVAVCEALRKVAGIDIKIKWPNDLLVRDRKLAGILTELSAETDRVRFVVIGIGVNVNTPLSLLPSRATSLKAELGRSASRVECLQEILRCLEKRYDQLNEEGFSTVIRQWKEFSSTLGQRIRIADRLGEVEGEAVDLDQDGGLLIRGDTGIIVKRMSGDVVPVV